MLSSDIGEFQLGGARVGIGRAEQEGEERLRAFQRGDTYQGTLGASFSRGGASRVGSERGPGRGAPTHCQDWGKATSRPRPSGLENDEDALNRAGSLCRAASTAGSRMVANFVGT